MTTLEIDHLTKRFGDKTAVDDLALRIAPGEVYGFIGDVFSSTHVLEVAEKLCDKVAIIRRGRLVRADTMAEVKGDESLEDVFLELETEAA